MIPCLLVVTRKAGSSLRSLLTTLLSLDRASKMAGNRLAIFFTGMTELMLSDSRSIISTSTGFFPVSFAWPSPCDSALSLGGREFFLPPWRLSSTLPRRHHQESGSRSPENRRRILFGPGHLLLLFRVSIRDRRSKSPSRLNTIACRTGLRCLLFQISRSDALLDPKKVNPHSREELDEGQISTMADEDRAQPRLSEDDGEECSFCKIARHEAESYVVLEDEISLAFLDKRPLFPGHSLLVTKTHYETFAELPQSLISPLFANAQLLALAVVKALAAEGSFIAINNRISQSVLHLHVHIVPRRRNDGLRGFFWPRQSYRSKESALETQRAIQSAIAELQRTK